MSRLVGAIGEGDWKWAFSGDGSNVTGLGTRDELVMRNLRTGWGCRELSLAGHMVCWKQTVNGHVETRLFQQTVSAFSSASAKGGERFKEEEAKHEVECKMEA